MMCNDDVVVTGVQPELRQTFALKANFHLFRRGGVGNARQRVYRSGKPRASENKSGTVPKYDAENVLSAASAVFAVF